MPSRRSRGTQRTGGAAANFLNDGEAIGGRQQEVGHPGVVLAAAAVEVFGVVDLGEDFHFVAVAVAAGGGEKALANLIAKGVVARIVDNAVLLAALEIDVEIAVDAGVEDAGLGLAPVEGEIVIELSDGSGG